MPDTDEGPVFAEGDYCCVAGTWHGRPPGSGLGNFNSHEVTEHEDGTITVSPSILISEPGRDRADWHGYLERGVWREV